MNVKKIASTLSRLMGDEATGAIDFDGYKWKVGEVNGTNIEYMYDLNDLIKYAPLFIKHLKRGESIENIAVSIPTEAYYASKLKDSGGLVKKMQDELRKNIPEAKEITILPQGASALNHLVSTNKIDLNKGNVLVIDGGFNTLNISVINKNGKILYSESIHDELGVYNLLTNFFREEIKKKYDEVSSNAQILKGIFLEEVIDAGFNSIKVKNEKQRAISAFVPKLINRVMRDLKKEKISFAQFVFVGGISYYINNENINTTKNFYLPKKDGEFLTVLGMRETVGENFDVFDIGFGDTKYILKGEK